MLYVVCIWQFQSPNLSVTSPFPTDNHKLLFYICDSICFVNKFICAIFLDSTYTWYHMIFVFLWLTVTHYDNLCIHPHCCKLALFCSFLGLGNTFLIMTGNFLFHNCGLFFSHHIFKSSHLRSLEVCPLLLPVCTATWPERQINLSSKQHS